VKRCSCGKKIVFGDREGQKAVPLDASAPVFAVEMVSDGRLSATRAPHHIVPGQPAYLVSHFATCARAGEFSSAKNERQQAIEELIAAAGEIRKQREGQLELGARPFEELVAELIRAHSGVTS
jgi:hypothetical protein